MDPATSAMAPHRGALALGSVLGTLGVVVGVVAFLAARDVHATADRFVSPDETQGIQATQAALDQAANTFLWRLIVPQVPRRLHAVAAEVGAGSDELHAAVNAYDAFRLEMERLALPARLMQGPERVTPVFHALRSISRPWHRQTLAAQEMRLQIQPFLSSKPPPNQLSAQLNLAPSGYTLVVTLRDATNALVSSTARMHLGDYVTLPVHREYTVEAAAWQVGSGGVTLAGQISFPLTSWPADGMVMPDGGRFRLAFALADDRLAPAPRMLTREARTQVES